eukprot:CAMPEP_0204567740 /NCGR_PEP_ID=MMETSP0661-20131031/36774_1 /ASSEMBLY_ACC=CAM_ASM_000606 /TAXON_ID=109239 /ORGANISM="Alexandrium margalefi, Strain AMGDE01CS-322" /LENGTH=279 /DNA_ID=CAMNT_0051575685 /DNA_START=66 /DNA_END=905 /DNA_ORIENTATION=-
MAPLLALAMLALGAPRSSAQRFGAEVISDIVTPAADEGRALGLKNERFWRPILTAADVEDVQGHKALYAQADAAIAALPAENAFVRQALGEALASLRRADSAVLAQAGQQSGLASERLATAPVSGEGGSSSVVGGQGLLALALKRLTDFGGYFSRLRGHVQSRQADAVQTLKGAASATGSVLSDCRTASKQSFEALKYDIYNRGVAKTPEAAKAVANRIVDASAETRRRFMKLVMATVQGIEQDTREQGQQPSAIVTRSLLEDMHQSERAGEKGPVISL